MGVELLFNSVEFGVQKQLPVEFQIVETRCGREGHTRPRGTSGSPDGVDPSNRRTRKTQRDGHNSGVKIWCLCSVSSTSHTQTLQIKWEVNIFLKKSSCVFLPASFLPASFIRASVVYHASVIIASVCIQYIYVYFCMNQQMTMQHCYVSLIKYRSFVYTQLNGKTVQFSIRHWLALSLNVNLKIHW